MRYLPEIFANNQQWARHIREHDPDYFERLAAEQHARILWIAVSGPLGVWVDHVSTVRRRHRDELEKLDKEACFRRLCELNTLAQIDSLASSSIVLDAWDRGQKLYLHCWLYDLATGLLTDLHDDREAWADHTSPGPQASVNSLDRVGGRA